VYLSFLLARCLRACGITQNVVDEFFNKALSLEVAPTAWATFVYLADVACSDQSDRMTQDEKSADRDVSSCCRPIHTINCRNSPTSNETSHSLIRFMTRGGARNFCIVGPKIQRGLGGRRTPTTGTAT